MPPKAKHSKKEIIDTAYEMVRKHGIDFLTARSLAAELGTSTAPIFTTFTNIEEVKEAVIDSAKALYKEYLRKGLEQSPPFKGTGLKYIEFAKNEPELFKLLFMQGTNIEVPTHFMPEGDENAPTVLSALKKHHFIEEKKARMLYNHLSVYAHGLAVLYAMGQCIFTMDDVDKMLSEVFNALKETERS